MSRFETHLWCAVWLATFVGLADALGTQRPAEALAFARTVIAGAAVGATFGLLIGLLNAAAHEALERLRRRLRRFGVQVRADVAQDVGVAVALLTAVATFLFVHRAFESVMVPSLKLTLLVLGAGGGTLLALTVARELSKRVRTTRIGRKAPRTELQVALHFALLRAAPMFFVSAFLLNVHAGQLAALRVGLHVANFLIAAYALFGFVRLRRFSSFARLASLQLLLTLLVSCLLLVRAGSDVLPKLKRARVLPDALVLLQRSTDFDRDGSSSWYGGRDCAPFDARRSPNVREVPGNGIDEDCDGADGVVFAARSTLSTFSSQPA
ncbi:MAG TPA: putative metal-binding motif-containing protein, partial [Polyangiales bacterium]|nr:putative metal-binding motif-containing protein [Polyangiales bacterium]